MTELQSEDISDLIADLDGFIARYVTLDEPSRVAVALWVVHTHTFTHLTVDETPYLAITSPVKQAGKSRLLEVLEALVARPSLDLEPSDATLFRSLASSPPPTLLLDELDAVFHRGSQRDGLRGLLNAGSRRGGTVPRTRKVGDAYEIERFPVFGPKALAAIGRLPDTVADRAISIEMKPRTPTRSRERFRRSRPPADAKELRDRADAWAKTHAELLSGAEPVIPAELTDRQADGWDALLAIAECSAVADVAFPERVRDVAVMLSLSAVKTRDAFGELALRDCHRFFSEKKRRRGRSATIVAYFKRLEGRPWGDWPSPAGFNAKALSNLLRPYGIKPHLYRPKNRDGAPIRGYYAADFVEPWSIHLPDVGNPLHPLHRYKRPVRKALPEHRKSA